MNKDRPVEGLKCPICLGKLVYKKGSGQGVSFCYNCGVSWMLLLLKRYVPAE